jgi:hypothetical protein
MLSNQFPQKKTYLQKFYKMLHQLKDIIRKKKLDEAEIQFLTTSEDEFRCLEAFIAFSKMFVHFLKNLQRGLNVKNLFVEFLPRSVAKVRFLQNNLAKASCRGRRGPCFLICRLWCCDFGCKSGDPPPRSLTLA